MIHKAQESPEPGHSDHDWRVLESRLKGSIGVGRGGERTDLEKQVIHKAQESPEPGHSDHDWRVQESRLKVKYRGREGGRGQT